MQRHVVYGTGGVLNPRNNGVVPTRAEAPWWNQTYTWDWYPISTWPSISARYWIAPHLHYRARWHLMMFFIGNGMSPALAYERLVDRMGNVTLSQDENLRDLANNAEEFLKLYGYWDMLAQRKVPGTRRFI